MEHTIIHIKYTLIKLDFAQQNQMPNVKSTTSINYSTNRFLYIVSKYSAKDHIPTNIQLISLLSTQM